MWGLEEGGAGARWARCRQSGGRERCLAAGVRFQCPILQSVGGDFTPVSRGGATEHDAVFGSGGSWTETHSKVLGKRGDGRGDVPNSKM